MLWKATLSQAASRQFGSPSRNGRYLRIPAVARRTTAAPSRSGVCVFRCLTEAGSPTEEQKDISDSYSIFCQVRLCGARLAEGASVLPKHRVLMAARVGSLFPIRPGHDVAEAELSVGGRAGIFAARNRQASWHAINDWRRSASGRTVKALSAQDDLQRHLPGCRLIPLLCRVDEFDQAKAGGEADD
jgi:hypothetical protein